MSKNTTNNSSYGPVVYGKMTYQQPQYTINSGTYHGTINSSFNTASFKTVNTTFDISDTTGNTIVSLDYISGIVTWSNGVRIDEAAEALARSLSLSSEVMAKITQRVKMGWRDIIFEEIIGIVERNGGSITSKELTTIHEAAKIMDKLQGKYD